MKRCLVCKEECSCVLQTPPVPVTVYLPVCLTTCRFFCCSHPVCLTTCLAACRSHPVCLATCLATCRSDPLCRYLCLVSIGWVAHYAVSVVAPIDLKQKSLERAALDDVIVAHLDGVVLEWCGQIEQILIEDSELTRKEPEDIGPKSELEYWRHRSQKFSTIIDQLKTRECRVTLGVLREAKASSPEVHKTLKSWKAMDNATTGAILAGCLSLRSSLSHCLSLSLSHCLSLSLAAAVSLSLAVSSIG